jgi:hypothetical protein
LDLPGSANNLTSKTAADCLAGRWATFNLAASRTEFSVSGLEAFLSPAMKRKAAGSEFAQSSLRPESTPVA